MMIGDYRSYAEAIGEREHPSVWVPGVDFDPSDPDEMEIMRDVWEKEKLDRIAVLEREVARLRCVLGE